MAKQKPVPTEMISTRRISQAVDSMVQMWESQRKNYERKWYDNNFFDDGKHFRYVSRSTGKIINLTDKAYFNIPVRAIPKASRQIRGVANLLLQPDYVPVVYPEKVISANFPPGQLDPQTGQMIPNPLYQQALQMSKEQAKKIGSWLQEEWKDQHLIEKLTLMVLLAAKNSVSYLQVWVDPVQEKLRTQVYDAFDIYVAGNLTSIYQSPSIIKAVPMLISEIKANEMFDEEMVSKINPDNKYASSQVKQAYLMSKYGTGQESDHAATLVVKEAFIKEYLCDANWSDVKKMGEDSGVMEGKNRGDMVMRHTFVAGGYPLLDEYIALDEYPFASFTFEPGPIYQTSLIERFIPANKTLDTVMNRLERYINTMTVGIYQKRKGENFDVDNRSGAQIIEYEQRPLEQMQMASIQAGVFKFIEQINEIIEEQGASTSALNQLPSGVKSGVAIESLKATEYANLKIPATQLKETIRNISERMIEHVGKYYYNPQTVQLLEQGEPSYFDLIGEKGIQKRQEINKRSPDSVVIPQDAIVIKPGIKVDIEIESGLGFTMQGRREAIQQVINYITVLVEQGLVSTEALKIITQRFLETFQFGATQEFMDAFDQGLATSQLSDQQLQQIKIALAEVVDDLNLAGPQKDESDIDKTKIGVTESLQDLAK